MSTPAPEAPGTPAGPARLAVADVRARRGASWLGQGFALFRGQPLAWIALSAGWLVITLGLLLVPLVGGVIANFLQPVFFASFALAARKQQGGGAVETGDLFLGFRTHPRTLINIGALLLFAEFAIFALMALVGLPTAADTPAGTMPDLAAYAKQLQGKEWILGLGLLATAAVKGALWFAPPLIAFHGLSTTHAIRWSVYAALSNLGAMLIYGLALMGLFLACTLTWGLGLIVVVPMMLASTYVGYREVFEKEPGALAPVATPGA